MSVGGRIIEMRLMPIVQDNLPVEVIRIWVMDRNGDELAVYAKPQEDMPALGDEVWWSSGKIYFDNDRHYLEKVAYSFRPKSD